MGRFDDKVVFVTGGAKGQGRSHALAFAKEGADIVVCDIARQIGSIPHTMGTRADLDETARMVEKLDQRCLAVTADVRSTEEINAAVDQAVTELGRVDVLLANAGVLSLTPVAEMTDEQLSDVVDTDLMGVFKAMRAVIPHMVAQGSGRIIATSSMAGRTGLPTVAHYCAAKWGVIGLVKSVAREVAASGVTVNCVCPTNVDTDMIHNEPFYALFAPGVERPSREDVIPGFTSLNAVPVPWIEAIDISNAMMFLASAEARYITGEALHVSAGWNAFNTA
ncbi:mycofactocin-coupled SDR family oxidoreductase [Pseudonocardia sp.]|uniref:mycofactocin-coupled SDR family oxidoreductase n=1 Tax=Pseudonocardia sp. TaxID=60912 RepID=UPI0026348432|nr:mycofactocin-coupled SDR family oxidoreductase [Pseudonocardia sp.]